MGVVGFSYWSYRRENKISWISKEKQNSYRNQNDGVYHRSAHQILSILVGCWDRSSALHWIWKKNNNKHTFKRFGARHTRRILLLSNKIVCWFHTLVNLVLYIYHVYVYVLNVDVRRLFGHNQTTKNGTSIWILLLCGMETFDCSFILATHNVLYAEAGRSRWIHWTSCWRGRRW